jgi:hypothetical protein
MGIVKLIVKLQTVNVLQIGVLLLTLCLKSDKEMQKYTYFNYTESPVNKKCLKCTCISAEELPLEIPWAPGFHSLI